jgi:hypothetical protein
MLYEYFEIGLAFALFRYLLNIVMIALTPSIYHSYYYSKSGHKFTQKTMNDRFTRELENINFMLITDIFFYPITGIIYFGLLLDLILLKWI